MPVVSDQPIADDLRPDPGPPPEALDDEDGRMDPEFGDIEPGLHTFGKLINEDPRMVYHFANKHGMFNISYFRALGYREVIYNSSEGVQLLMGQDSHEDGCVIESMGQVLMQIPREQHKKLLQRQQRRADLNETHIANRPGMVDPLRGQHGGVFKENRQVAGIRQSQEVKTSVIRGRVRPNMG